MAKYRKKPVVVEAFCYSPDGPFPDWIIGKFIVRYPVAEIDTLEGVMTAQPGDWIIQGVKGEVYSCKPDIFSATYDNAVESPMPGEDASGWTGADRYNPHGRNR